MSRQELYPGQREVVAGKLAQAEGYQEADRERLKHITEPAERESILRRIAGREGLLATQRRFLAQLTGGDVDGVRDRVLRIRVTTEEHARLTADAEEAGQTVGQYIRDRITG